MDKDIILHTSSNQIILCEIYRITIACVMLHVLSNQYIWQSSASIIVVGAIFRTKLRYEVNQKKWNIAVKDTNLKKYIHTCCYPLTNVGTSKQVHRLYRKYQLLGLLNITLPASQLNLYSIFMYISQRWCKSSDFIKKLFWIPSTIVLSTKTKHEKKNL